jgi:1-acyl-sn-glycerol-3-phosphate acyltransferase
MFPLPTAREYGKDIQRWQGNVAFVDVEFQEGDREGMGVDLGKRRSPLVYGFVKTIVVITFRLCYRIRVQGFENIPSRGPAIILPKHQFWTDIPIVSLALGPQMNYVAKTELFEFPFVKTFLSLLGGIPVDREKTTKTMGSFRYILQLLREREYLVIFPEGTYYRGKVGKGKSRLIQMILRWQGHRGTDDTDTVQDHIPFVPMGIRYGGKGLRRIVNVKIGKPIFAEGEEAPKVTDRIIESIAQLSGLPH